ncbi:trehalose-phosphatase [Maricaulis parjimensis]|uniref:trehalose-phosphatase n=1 Tax=Maricaulis parjimensis TaxID=144023 RepID=UPI001EEEB19E|nr:trehalose-phosphatase [Maricaulis parjimensis]
MTRHAQNGFDRPFPLDLGGHALFLDFDGTLAGIQSNPDTVFLSPERIALLQSLSSRMNAALAVVSGRDVRDLDRRIPGDIWRVGGHGSDICAPGQRPRAYSPTAPDTLHRALFKLAGEHKGTRLEVKGPVLALHYREAPEAGKALCKRLTQILADQPGYSLQAGKMVFEAKPDAASKARAIARLMQMPPFRGRQPVMVGDDVTDEDGMREAIDRGGRAVKVGSGHTVAGNRLADPQQVWTWLEDALA